MTGSCQPLHAILVGSSLATAESKDSVQQDWLGNCVYAWAVQGFLICCVLRDFERATLLLAWLHSPGELADLLQDVQVCIFRDHHFGRHTYNTYKHTDTHTHTHTHKETPTHQHIRARTTQRPPFLLLTHQLHLRFVLSLSLSLRYHVPRSPRSLTHLHTPAHVSLTFTKFAVEQRDQTTLAELFVGLDKTLAMDAHRQMLCELYEMQEREL
jgi:hypothetical protein